MECGDTRRGVYCQFVLAKRSGLMRMEAIMPARKLFIIPLITMVVATMACSLGGLSTQDMIVGPSPTPTTFGTGEDSVEGPDAPSSRTGQRMDDLIDVGDLLLQLMTSGYSVPEPGPTDIRHLYPEADGDYLLYIWVDMLIGEASDLLDMRQEIATLNTDLGELVSAHSMQANYENVTLVFVAETPCSECLLYFPGDVAVDLTTDSAWNADPDAGRLAGIPLQIPGASISVVNDICLQIELSFPQLDEEPSLDIEDSAITILESSGIRVQDAGQDCDATLSLNLTGEAESDRYTSSQWSGTKECWTGVSLTGEASLATDTETLTTFSVVAIKEPATATLNCDTIDNAPWYHAWPRALLETLYTIWGPDILLPVLRVKESYLRTADDTWLIEAATALLAQTEPSEQIVQALILLLESEQFLDVTNAADALSAMGPEPGVVPALIEALDDSPQGTQDQILDALIIVTGQNFGTDVSQWRIWWNSQ